MTEPVFLLDTNICIYVLADEDSLAARRLAECPLGSVVGSVVTYAELLHGVRNAEPKEVKKLEAFFGRVAIVPLDVAAARAYGTLPFRRGSYDRLIAAHALALDLTLVTNNLRDFADVPGLKVENWAGP
ncbi:MAG: tRNA(fMet)-specific endonuclease VapC [Sphingomonadales bacterium]|nr:tRNA(fMet)-specific endonuclease VapC [Sphingomonadales bacterium]